MTLRHLKIFVTVCIENSITRAAEKLSIAQPSVSLAIAELEKHYEVKLFERIKQRLVITEVGKALHEQACLVLNSFALFEEMAMQTKAYNIVKIGSSLTIGQYMIPKIVKYINSKYPDIKINIKINQAKAIEKLVLQGELDFGLVEGEPTSSELIIKQFSKDKLVAVAGIEYQVENDLLNIENIKQHNFILREKGSAARDYFDRYLDKNKLSIEPYIESINTQVIISCLISNLGISILPFSLVREFVRRKQLKILEFPDATFERTYNIIVNKNKTLTKAQLDVFNLCLNYEQLMP